MLSVDAHRPLELPALRTDLLWRPQRLMVPSPCAANGLWWGRVKEGSSPSVKLGKYGLQLRRINNDKEDDGHSATFERNRREGAWLLWQQGRSFGKLGFSFSFHLPILPPRQRCAAAGDER